jgi:uncharacterized membrane protein
VELGQQIHGDPLLAPNNRELAFDMLRHFARYRSTLGRRCALVSGLVLVLASVILYAAGVTEEVPSIMIVVGLALIALWGGCFYAEAKHRKQLRKREAAAMEFARRAPLDPAII